MVTTRLGLDPDTLARLAERWDDDGLWADIRVLAGRAWRAQSDLERTLEWHHLVMAIGNFKRQPGRRLYPADLSLLDPGEVAGTGPRAEFQVPQSDKVIVVDQPDTWDLGFHGVGVPTMTTLLAALWSESHHVFDWRVLAAAAGLTLETDEDLRFVGPDDDRSLEPDWPRYSRVRELLLRVVDDSQGALSLLTVERALYVLSQRMAPSKGRRSWRDYQAALLAAV